MRGKGRRAGRTAALASGVVVGSDGCRKRGGREVNWGKTGVVGQFGEKSEGKKRLN